MVLTVGAVLRGDDAVGPYLAKLLENEPAPNWEVLDGGQMPEDFVSVVRREHPRVLVVVDAASMELEPGALRRLSADDVATDYMMTTHSLPISFMLSELESCCDELIFLGIQPAQMEFMGALPPAVRETAEELHTRFVQGYDFSAVPALAVD